MSRTYKATGINLKSMPFGESDRLLTILTRELGLIRVLAPGARKHRSRLGGRTSLFVVNELLIAQGRSLDKITQAETLESYAGLGQDLGKLAAGQYLAELVLSQALSDQPQEELFALLSEHLSRLESLPNRPGPESLTQLVAYLTHGIYHLLALAGTAPQVHACCVTQRPLIPNFTDPNWRVGFSSLAGGTVSLSELANLQAEPPSEAWFPAPSETGTGRVQVLPASPPAARRRHSLHNRQINAKELALLQQLAAPQLPPAERVPLLSPWMAIERILRHYAQYHLGCFIRSAALIDTYLDTIHRF